MKKDPNKPAKLGVWGTAKYVYGEAGFKGLYRGVTPRIALGVWQTICMVALGDVAKVDDVHDNANMIGIYCKYDGRKAYWTLIVCAEFAMAFTGKNLIIEKKLSTVCVLGLIEVF
jgi:hypothetical protein